MARLAHDAVRIPVGASRAALCAASLLLASGCGATTVRVTAAPTVDTSGRAGFESTVGFGIGMPVDFKGERSHHYLQEMTSLGGAYDGATRAGAFVLRESVDYLYWANPRMDVRAGAHFVLQDVDTSPTTIQRYGMGAHFALVPMVLGDDTGWLVHHLGVGAELSAEALHGPSGWLGRAALPLVVELSFLAAGD